MPEISIIIPVYNAEKYILRCIESIKNQTYKDFEVIAVNDGSGDCSLEILRKLESKYDFMKIFSKENGGAASARNLGLEKATGNFVCFVDCDDWLEKKYLEVLVENIKAFDADISMVGINRIEEAFPDIQNKELLFTEKKITADRSEIKMLQAGCFCNAITTFETNFIGMGTPWDKLFKLSLIRKNNIVFNRELKTGEDTLFCWEYFNFVKKFVYENKSLYNYVVYSNSLSKKFVEIEDFYKTINVFYDKISQNMEEITKKSLYYVIFRHFLSLLKKHFTNSQNKNSIKEYRTELKDVLKKTEMEFAISNLSLEILSKKERLILHLLKTPAIFSALLYALAKLK